MGAKVLKWEMREMCTVSKRVLILSKAGCLCIKDLVLNKDPFFGILGPYWVLFYISGSLLSLFWFHSRGGWVPIRRHMANGHIVYEKLNKSYEAHHL